MSEIGDENDTQQCAEVVEHGENIEQDEEILVSEGIDTNSQSNSIALLAEYQEKANFYRIESEKLQQLLLQREKTISLYEREKIILEKEKQALNSKVTEARTEKEAVVMRYAIKEKSMIDSKKAKEQFEKQISDTKKELKLLTGKFQILNEEKSRLMLIIDEKCNDVKKHQKDNEKLKTDITNLETKVKWMSLKLSQEVENKSIFDKQTNENVRVAEERASEKLRIEHEANLILMKHETEKRDQQINNLKRENQSIIESLHAMELKLQTEMTEKSKCIREFENEKSEHIRTQNTLSQELLSSAKIRNELDNLKVLFAKNAVDREENAQLQESLQNLEQKYEDTVNEIEQLRSKEKELLSINMEMTERIVELQNDILLKKSKLTATLADNELLRKEKLTFDTKLNELEKQLNEEIKAKNDERILLTKHLSEKTKLYEIAKKKLDYALGDFEAYKNKQSQVTKELHREITKYRKQVEEFQSIDKHSTQQSDNEASEVQSEASSIPTQSDNEAETSPRQTVANGSLPEKELSQKQLVERILRLQQAAIRKTEKIDFLENHTISLVSELQKKSKLLHYYMLRDQAGALTSTKSDQNKSELSKYGGVMSAIYGGLKNNNNQTMTLELSLEINRKLQAVLEDTLLKNITLKENLDIMGLEVDKLTRQLNQK